MKTGKNPPRMPDAFGQPDSQPHFLRLRGVAMSGDANENRRLRWDVIGNSYKVTTEAVRFYGRDGSERILQPDEETLVLWRPPAKQYEEVTSAGNSATIFTGQAVGAVSSSQATFLVDNINVISGTDPRTTPDDAAEQITVRNYWRGSSLDNDLWLCFLDEDSDPVEYAALRPAAGTGDTFQRFELTAGLALGDNTGDAHREGTTDDIKVLDPAGKWAGLTGYTGTAKLVTLDHEGSGLPGYEIVEMETVSYIALVSVTGTYVAGGTECSVLFAPAHADANKAPSTPIDVVDAHSIVSTASAGDKWVAGYDAAGSRWVLLFAKLTQGTGGFVWIDDTVAGASISSSTLTPGTGTVKECVAKSGGGYEAGTTDVDVVNFSPTPVMGSTGNPLVLRWNLHDSGEKVLVWPDLSGVNAAGGGVSTTVLHFEAGSRVAKLDAGEC